MSDRLDPNNHELHLDAARILNNCSGCTLCTSNGFWIWARTFWGSTLGIYCLGLPWGVYSRATDSGSGVRTLWGVYSGGLLSVRCLLWGFTLGLRFLVLGTYALGIYSGGLISGSTLEVYSRATDCGSADASFGSTLGV